VFRIDRDHRSEGVAAFEDLTPRRALAARLCGVLFAVVQKSQTIALSHCAVKIRTRKHCVDFPFGVRPIRNRVRAMCDAKKKHACLTARVLF
jgi:hypothetical protein